MKTPHRLGLFVCLLGGLLLMTSAQERGFGQRRAPVPTKAFIVGGVRHGATFFSRSNYPEIKPLKEGEIDFKHYHTYDETNFFLKKWAADYPNLIDLYSVGKTDAGQWEQAQGAYQKAIELDPNFQSAYANLGVVYYQLGKLDLSASQYQKALELNPADGDVAYNLGALYLQQALLKSNPPEPEMVKRAVDQLQQAIKLNPDLAELMLVWG